MKILFETLEEIKNFITKNKDFLEKENRKIYFPVTTEGDTYFLPNIQQVVDSDIMFPSEKGFISIDKLKKLSEKELLEQKVIFNEPLADCLFKSTFPKKIAKLALPGSCPIGKHPMVFPVFTTTTKSYELLNILLWLKNHDTDPVTHEKITLEGIIPNHALQSYLTIGIKKTSYLNFHINETLKALASIYQDKSLKEAKEDVLRQYNESSPIWLITKYLPRVVLNALDIQPNIHREKIPKSILQVKEELELKKQEINQSVKSFKHFKSLSTWLYYLFLIYIFLEIGIVYANLSNSNSSGVKTPLPNEPEKLLKELKKHTNVLTESQAAYNKTIYLFLVLFSVTVLRLSISSTRKYYQFKKSNIENQLLGLKFQKMTAIEKTIVENQKTLETYVSDSNKKLEQLDFRQKYREKKSNNPIPSMSKYLQQKQVREQKTEVASPLSQTDSSEVPGDSDTSFLSLK